MGNIAAVIITFNEEKNIADVIASSKKVTEEILVIDSGSTDRTVDIARALGAKVIHRAWDNDFAAARNFAVDKTQTKWLLYIDADERISAELASSIKKAVNSGKEQIFAFKRKNIVFGKLFKYGVFRPDRVKRLLPREQTLWRGKVHEDVKSDLPVVVLPGDLLHYPYDNWEQYMVKFNNYTTIWARGAFERGKRTSLAGALGHAVFSFVKMAVFERGIFDGLLGFNMCCLHFAYTLVKYLKLYDLQVR